MASRWRRVGRRAGYGIAKIPRGAVRSGNARPSRSCSSKPPAIGPTQAQVSQQPSPPVAVAKPRMQSVSNYVEITGNAAAVNAGKADRTRRRLSGQAALRGRRLRQERRSALHDPAGPVQGSAARRPRPRCSPRRRRCLRQNRAVGSSSSVKKDAATQTEVDKWHYQRLTADAHLLGAQAQVAPGPAEPRLY